MLTSQDLQRFIDQNQIDAEILSMTVDTPTVPDAARALGVTEDQIIKSLVFLIDGEPALVIANGTHKVDSRLVARHFGVGRKKVKMARPQQALEITDYVVGAMPPFGHKTPFHTIVDPGVVAQTEVFAGGGDVNAMIRLATDDLLRVTGAEIVSVWR